MSKHYLGNGVYVEFVEGGAMKLTAENGVAVTTDIIFIEPQTWVNLLSLKQRKEKTRCPQCGSDVVVKIPSSTMPIEDVSEEVLKRHLSVHNICSDCLEEW